MRIQEFLLVAVFLMIPSHVLAKQRPVTTLPKDVLNAPAETLGTVVGTIGVRRIELMSMTSRVGQSMPIVEGGLLFRKIGSAEFGSIDFSYMPLVGQNTRALKDQEFSYAAFKMDLPEGEYEIFRANAIYHQSRPGCAHCPVTSTNEREFSVPFVVKRGRVMYLGSFLARGTAKLGATWPPHVPDFAYYSYADKWQRDSSVFTSGPLAVDLDLIEHASLVVNESTEYFIIAEDHVPGPVWKRRDLEAGLTTFAAKVEAYKSANSGTPRTP